MKKRTVTVNDTMQRGYSYQLVEPAGRNFDPEFRPGLTPKQMLTEMSCYPVTEEIMPGHADFLVAGAVLRNESPAAVSLLTGKRTGTLV